MKRFIFALAVLAAAALLGFLLLPSPKPSVGGDAGPVVSTVAPAAMPLPERAVEAEAVERLEAARVEAEEKAAALQRKLDDAEEAAAERVKRKRPFADPEIRKVMAREADAGVERSVAALLDAGLAADLKLTDDQQGELRALLEERGGIGFKEILIPLAAGELEGPRLAAAGRNVKEAYARNTARIRGLLGNEGYAVYDWYQKTQQDRDTVKRIAPEFARGGQELTAEQQSQLAALLIQERAGFKFDQDFTDPEKIDYEHFHDIFNRENTERHFGETQRFHERVAQRAAGMLNPDQHKLLQEILAAHAARSKLTVRSTRAMMGENE